VFLLSLVLVFSVFVVDAQTKKKKKTTAVPAATTTTTPPVEPLVISRAEDFPDEGSVKPVATPTPSVDSSNAYITDLENRIRSLESSSNKKDPDAKQKRLLLNLDILTRAEQRSETLRKQSYDLLEKESDIHAKMDRIEYELRPESIDKTVAFAGTLRPEELRANRRKSLESEKANLQSLLTEIQRTRSNLEVTLERSDALVEKLRTKLEKEIDTALDDDPKDQ
jgi:hypothetical protein